MKVTKRQLRRIIREAIDVVDPETGEVFLEFGDDGFAPDAAWPELQRRLNIQSEPPPPGVAPDDDTVYIGGDDRDRLEDETVGKRGARAADAREKKLNIDNLLARVDQWAADAGADFLADNPGADMQGFAPDLARSIEYEFDNDEWNELVWHFDDVAWETGDNEDGTDILFSYVADRLTG